MISGVSQEELEIALLRSIIIDAQETILREFESCTFNTKNKNKAQKLSMKLDEILDDDKFWEE